MQDHKPTKPVPRLRARYRWLIAGAVVLFLLYQFGGPLLTRILLQPVRVVGQAMMPTLRDGDRIFVQRRFAQLQRGDIVIFYFPHDTSVSYIKRIVGLPGETIFIEDGKVTIDGQPLAEPYMDADYFDHLTLPEPFKIPDQHYYVLGDNRRNSSDSRYWGTVPRDLIYGKFWRRYWANN